MVISYTLIKIFDQNNERIPKYSLILIDEFQDFKGRKRSQDDSEELKDDNEELVKVASKTRSPPRSNSM